MLSLYSSALPPAYPNALPSSTVCLLASSAFPTKKVIKVTGSVNDFLKPTPNSLANTPNDLNLLFKLLVESIAFCFIVYALSSNSSLFLSVNKPCFSSSFFSFSISRSLFFISSVDKASWISCLLNSSTASVASFIFKKLANEPPYWEIVLPAAWASPPKSFLVSAICLVKLSSFSNIGIPDFNASSALSNNSFSFCNSFNRFSCNEVLSSKAPNLSNSRLRSVSDAFNRATTNSNSCFSSARPFFIFLKFLSVRSLYPFW